MQEYILTAENAKRYKMRLTVSYWQKLYDLILEHQEELGLTEYMFDWYFNWRSYGYTIDGGPTCGCDVSNVIPFLTTPAWINFINELKQYNCPWGKDKNYRERYLSAIVYYLRPQFDFKIKQPKSNKKVQKKKVKAKLKNAYVYAIIGADGKVQYIGQTQRELKERLSEHIEQAISPRGNSSQDQYLYKAMREGYYRFEILYESHNKITGAELDKKEKEFITKLQPKYNYEGVVVSYVAQHSKVKSGHGK